MTVDAHITRTPVGFNASVNVSVQPLTAFRPEWLLVPKEVAVHFVITGIKVGRSSQLTQTTVLPATLFVDKSAEVRLKIEPCQVSMLVTVSVTNIDSEAHMFEAHVLGELVL